MSKRKALKYESGNIFLEVSSIVSSSLDIEKVSDLILKESASALKADHAALFLVDEKGNFTLARARGFSGDELDNIRLMGSWEVINRQLVKKRKSILVNNISDSRMFKTKKIPFSGEKLPLESFLAVPLVKYGKMVGALIVSNRKRPGSIFTKRDEKLLLALSNNIVVALLNAKLYQKLKSLFVSTVKSLVRAVDAKDPYTSGHSERVMRYSLMIGKELKLSEEKLENLGLASLMHDVGKIGIKEEILAKPGKLSDDEKKEIEGHPAIGVRIVETIEDSGKITRGILEHHEKVDGTGYPNHLKGSEISIEGKIIAVADTFDALTTDRPYQKGFEDTEALSRIISSTSTQFDPKVVKAFIATYSKNSAVWKG